MTLKDTSTATSTLTGTSGGAATYRELWQTLDQTKMLGIDEFYKLFKLHDDEAELMENLLDTHPLACPIGLLVLVEATEGDTISYRTLAKS